MTKKVKVINFPQRNLNKKVHVSDNKKDALEDILSFHIDNRINTLLNENEELINLVKNILSEGESYL